MKSQHKAILLISLIAILITILDFSEMIYNRLFGNEGTFVEYYDYDMSPEDLLNRIIEIKKHDTTLQFPNDTSLLGEFANDWTYVGFFDKENNKYFHTWVHTVVQFDKGTGLVFYGISDTPNFDDAKRINRDFDYMSKRFTIHRFETLVKNRIDKK